MGIQTTTSLFNMGASKILCNAANNSGVVLTTEDAERILNSLSRLGYCVEKIRRLRTTGDKSQNHHLNSHIQQLTEFFGASFDHVKTELKYMACDTGKYRFRTRKKTGERLPYSETEIDTKECAVLIEMAHIMAAEYNVILREE